MTDQAERTSTGDLGGSLSGIQIQEHGNEIAGWVAGWWETWGGRAAVVAVVIGVGIVAAGTVQLVRVVRSVKSRRRLAMVPSSQFDPSIEEVLRFAGQVSRVRQAVSRWMPVRARTVRVTLTSVGEGRMAYVVSGPSAVEELLRQRPYAQVDVADPATVGRRSGPPLVGPSPAGGVESGGGEGADIDGGDRGPAGEERLSTAATAVGEVVRTGGRAVSDVGGDDWTVLEQEFSGVGRVDEEMDWVLEHPEELAAQGRSWAALDDL